MKNVLILGIGGSGAAVAESHFVNRNREQGFSYLAMDTDLQALEGITGIPTLPLTEHISLGEALDRLDPQATSDYFPCDDSQGKVQYYRTLEMGRGANGWRMKGLLSLDDMLSDPEKREIFTGVLDGLVDETEPERPIEIVLAASLAGGTGSALFLPVAMYIRKYFVQKYERNVTVKALLSCPDVYTGLLTAENKIRAYANAYAALAELNAVDLVSRGYNTAAEAESKLRIRFRIGSRRSKGIGLLFDSEDSEFCERSAQPFAQVYLFDRIPGVSTVAAHEQIMTKLLGVISDEAAESKSGGIYSAISFAEVRFAHDSIVDYVAKRSVYDDLEQNWLLFYRSVRVEELYGRNATYNFAKSVTEVYRARCASEEYDPDSEGEKVIFPGDPKIFAEDCSNYIQELKKNLCAMLDASVPEEMGKEIAAAKEGSCPPKAIGFSRKKKANAVRQQAQNYCKLLCAYLQTQSAGYRKMKAGLKALLLDEGEEISLMRNAITYGGEYLHPVTALLYLCELYCAIKDSSKFGELPSSEFEEPCIDQMTPPDFLFEAVKFDENVNRQYAALGQRRLAEVAFTAPEKLLYRFAGDLSELQDDFVKLCSAIQLSYGTLLMESACEVIAELIENYRAVFDSVSDILDDHRVDVKFALIANTSSNCTLMNVGCSEENKRKAYAYYRSEKEQDSPDRIGRIVFNGLGKEIRGTLFEALEEEERREVLQTAEIKRACERDIFRVLHDRDIFKEDLSERSRDHDLVRALSLAALPLDLSMPETPRDEIKEGTVSLVPAAAAEFARNWLNEPELPLQQALEKYTYLTGGCESELVLSDAVPKDAIFSTKKISGFPLYLFNKVNEENANGGYYGDYKKALGVMRKQETQMWNPHLVKESAMGFLPFVNPSRRDAFETNVYKAVLYLLQYGRLSAEQDGEEENVFFYEWDGQREPAMCKDKPVKAKNPELLFGFMRENIELTEDAGRAFDVETEKQIALLPPVGFAESDLLKFEREIANGRFASFLCNDLFAYVCSEPPVKAKNFVDFLYDLTEKKTSEEATNLAKTIAAVFRTMIYSRPLGAEELYVALYSRIMQSLRSVYEQAAKRAGRRLYRNKADRVFLLLDEAWASLALQGKEDREDTLC